MTNFFINNLKGRKMKIIGLLISEPFLSLYLNLVFVIPYHNIQQPQLDRNFFLDRCYFYTSNSVLIYNSSFKAKRYEIDASSDIPYLLKF